MSYTISDWAQANHPDAPDEMAKAAGLVKDYLTQSSGQAVLLFHQKFQVVFEDLSWFNDPVHRADLYVPPFPEAIATREMRVSRLGYEGLKIVERFGKIRLTLDTLNSEHFRERVRKDARQSPAYNVITASFSQGELYLDPYITPNLYFNPKDGGYIANPNKERVHIRIAAGDQTVSESLEHLMWEWRGLSKREMPDVEILVA